MAVAAILATVSTQAQTKRSDDFRARYELKEVLFYANSRQRTFATAKYFSAGFLPFANVEITHKFEEDKMDPVFTPQFTKMNDAYRQQVLDENERVIMGDGEGYRFIVCLIMGKNGLIV